jgi:hypothetical protein
MNLSQTIHKYSKGPFWSHPVVFGGRLYIRHSDKLFVYDISGNLPGL